MKRLILYIIVLVVAVWLGLFLSSDPGYMLIAYKKWTIETSLWFGIILLAVLFFVLYYLIRFIKLLFASRGHILRWHKQKRFVKAHTVTGGGLLALEEADWDTAERLLIQGVKSTSTPVINYLGAARAAQEQQDYEKRDGYLKSAFELANGDEKIAVSLTKARLQIEHHQYESAVAVLTELHEKKPKHAYVLKLLYEAYIALEDYHTLAELLPKLKKRRALDPEDLIELELKLDQHHIETATSIDSLKKVWSDLPRIMRRDPILLKSYCKRLIGFGAQKDADKIIADHLKQNPNSELVGLLRQ